MTALRICIVYDCIFPWTIGGAERWYRNLAEQLAAEGHDVTYLTMKQWADNEPPQLSGLRIVPVAPQMPLYTNGKRRILPPLLFGFGVLRHLGQHRSSYDWVHTASFPYFSLLAAALIQPFARFRIAVDWHEAWSREYWREYLGIGGFIGWTVQKLCARVPQIAYTFSELHHRRLKSLGLTSKITVLTGEYAGGEHEFLTSATQPPTIVYAGRFIPEKRLGLLVDALALAMHSDDTVRAVLYGAGPDFERIRDRVDRLGLASRIALPGFVSSDEVDRGMQSATAIVQPSAREGYGMVVVEASARGVPVVVVAGDDNAATELVDHGQNGFTVGEAEPRQLAQAIRSCIAGGDALRAQTRRWYKANEERLSLRHSLKCVVHQYAAAEQTRIASLQPQSAFPRESDAS